MDANADLKTAIQITPEKSQVFILSLVLVVALSLIAGFVFLWHKPELSYIPFTCAGVAAIMAWASWYLSHKNVDMHGATPTSIAVQSDGALSVITDPRILNSVGGQLALAQLVSAVAYRHPLPIPAGVVDSNGRPVQNSRNEAFARVESINQEVAHATEQVFGSVKRAELGPLVEQPKIAFPAGAEELSIRSNSLASDR